MAPETPGWGFAASVFPDSKYAGAVNLYTERADPLTPLRPPGETGGSRSPSTAVNAYQLLYYQILLFYMLTCVYAAYNRLPFLHHAK